MNGTPIMRGKKFTLPELCKLIEVCNTMNVSLIRVGDVELIFKDDALPKEQIEIKVPSLTDEQKQITIAPDTVPEVDPAVLQQLEADFKQAQLDQMMIVDPAQFEELLAAGDIVHEQRTENE